VHQKHDWKRHKPVCTLVSKLQAARAADATLLPSPTSAAEWAQYQQGGVKWLTAAAVATGNGDVMRAHSVELSMWFRQAVRIASCTNIIIDSLLVCSFRPLRSFDLCVQIRCSK
jgi:hypothetical protein